MALNGVVESKGNPYTKAGADKRITKYYTSSDPHRGMIPSW